MDYFEELQRAEWRESEWRMLNAALRKRRVHVFRRGVLSAAFWIFGIR